MRLILDKVSSQSPKLVQCIAQMLIIVALGIFVIFAVLKEDGQTSVKNWPWSLVVIPPIACAVLFFTIWAFFQYHKEGLSYINKERWTMDTVRRTLAEVPAENIETFHERYMFRDVMMLFVYTVSMIYASLINATKCPRCDVPLSMFSTAVIVVSVFRGALLLLRAYFDFHRFRELANELRHYKSWREENRLREYVVPALANRFQLNPYSIAELVFFIVSVFFLGLATVWVETGACIHTCSKGYHLTKHLVVTLYVFETAYMLSVVGMYYFRRSLGVERLELAIAWMDSDNAKRAEIRKEQMKRGLSSKDDPFTEGY